MNLIIATGVVIGVLATIATVVAVATAPEGYQDDDGFHMVV